MPVINFAFVVGALGANASLALRRLARTRQVQHEMAGRVLVTIAGIRGSLVVKWIIIGYERKESAAGLA